MTKEFRRASMIIFAGSTNIGWKQSSGLFDGGEFGHLGEE